jgi:hypothetical protein
MVCLLRDESSTGRSLAQTNGSTAGHLLPRRFLDSIRFGIRCAPIRGFKSSARKGSRESRQLFRGSLFASLGGLFPNWATKLRCLLPPGQSIVSLTFLQYRAGSPEVHQWR